jgi:hypothetical protein
MINLRPNVFKPHGLEQDSNTESIPILISMFHEGCGSDTLAEGRSSAASTNDVQPNCAVTNCGYHEAPAWPRRNQMPALLVGAVRIFDGAGRVGACI